MGVSVRVSVKETKLVDITKWTSSYHDQGDSKKKDDKILLQLSG